jgi:hypothetical protein
VFAIGVLIAFDALRAQAGHHIGVGAAVGQQRFVAQASLGASGGGQTCWQEATRDPISANNRPGPFGKMQARA